MSAPTTHTGRYLVRISILFPMTLRASSPNHPRPSNQHPEARESKQEARDPRCPTDLVE